MVDFIALAVLAAMLGSAITYIVKAKKKGVFGTRLLWLRGHRMPGGREMLRV